VAVHPVDPGPDAVGELLWLRRWVSTRCVGCDRAGRSAQPDAPVRFAFSARMFSDVNENDAGRDESLGAGDSEERASPWIRGSRFSVSGGHRAEIRGKRIDAITCRPTNTGRSATRFHLARSSSGARTPDHGTVCAARRGDSGIERLAICADTASPFSKAADQPGAGLARDRAAPAPAWSGRAVLGRMTESTKLLRAILPSSSTKRTLVWSL